MNFGQMVLTRMPCGRGFRPARDDFVIAATERDEKRLICQPRQAILTLCHLGRFR